MLVEYMLEYIDRWRREKKKRALLGKLRNYKYAQQTKISIALKFKSNGPVAHLMQIELNFPRTVISEVS